MASQPIVEARAIEKSYPQPDGTRIQVVGLTDFNIEPGKIIVLLGTSGCGKSTLLRVLNRMYALYPGQRATGDVRLDGESIFAPSVDVASLRYRVGMVFQKPTPFPMTIFDNVAFGLHLAQRISRARAAESAPP